MTMVVWPERANRLQAMNRSQEMDSETAAAGIVAGRVYEIVMAGGGTGGHLYPGLAVAGALKARVEASGGSLNLLWAATPRAVDQRLLGGFGERYIRQPVQPLAPSIGKLWGFWKGWRESCAFWAAYLDQNKIDCVVALGGYAAGPAAYVAAKRKIPVVLLNPDALPGRANRFLFKRANVIVTQWALRGEQFANKVKALGCPIRPELVNRTRVEGAKRLRIDPVAHTLVVTGASLGAKTINDAMPALLEDAKIRRAFEGSGNSGGGWQILHLAGLEQAAAVRAAYNRFRQVAVQVIDYCDDMASVWAVADLAIARAGASTCAELTACGVPSILLPYPFHKDMHQRANAEELAKAGAAVIVDDVKESRTNAAGIKNVLETLLYDDSRRLKMAQAAKAAGKPQAADAIAGEILALIAGSSR